MELSTKKIFSSKFNKAKTKIFRTKRKTIPSLNSNLKIKDVQSSKEKKKIQLNYNDSSVYKINPFTSNQKIEKNRIKYNLSSKLEISKFNIFKKKTAMNNTKEEISDFTNAISILDSKPNKQNQDEFDFDKLYQEFKNSELKSGFIIDNNGNNNLNSKQKKIIENYFEMKNEHLQKNLQKNINKCKINLQKEIKFDNFAKRKTKTFFTKLFQTRNNLNFGRKFFSTKQNIQFRNLIGIDIDKQNINNKSKDNNSLFETLSDSSFIDSSEDENEKLISTIKGFIKDSFNQN